MFWDHDQFARNKIKSLTSPIKVRALGGTRKRKCKTTHGSKEREKRGQGWEINRREKQQQQKTLLPQGVKELNDVKAIDSAIVTYTPRGNILWSSIMTSRHMPGYCHATRNATRQFTTKDCGGEGGGRGNIKPYIRKKISELCFSLSSHLHISQCCISWS